MGRSHSWLWIRCRVGADDVANGMRLRINGETRELDVHTVEALLVALALPVDRVAVEQNGAIVRRPERAHTPVNDDDVFEIVTLVGGG